MLWIGCKLQNSIISEGCVIESKCQINQCQVGPNTTLSTGTEIVKQQVKNESGDQFS